MDPITNNKGKGCSIALGQSFMNYESSLFVGQIPTTESKKKSLEPIHLVSCADIAPGIFNSAGNISTRGIWSGRNMYSSGEA